MRNYAAAGQGIDRRFRTILLVCGALLALLAVGLLFTAKANAISWVGPDPSEYGGANAYYELSNTPDVLSTSMQVPVYYGARPAVALVGVVCRDGGGTIDIGGKLYCPANGTISIPGAAFSYDPASKLYVATITATITGGLSANNYRAFRFTAMGGLVGYSANNTSHFAVGNIDRCDLGGVTSGCNKYFNYRLPFAPQCSLPGGNTSVQLYDSDLPFSGNQYNIQPYKNFNYAVVDMATGKNVVTSVNGGFGNNQTANLNFRYLQGHKYELFLDQVYSNNVIQFHLPFDSIYYNVNCDNMPTGSLTLSCDPQNATGNVDATFSDVDAAGGNTQAFVVVGTWQSPTAVNATSHSWTGVPANQVAGTWTAHLYALDVGPDGDGTYHLVSSVSHAGCGWSLASTAGPPAGGTVFPGQTIPFTFNTKDLGPGTTASFGYHDELQYYTAGVPQLTQFQPAPDQSTALAAGASTALWGGWSVTVPLTPNYDKVCAWRATTVTSSSNSAPATSNVVCFTINRPSCGPSSVTPTGLEPTIPFTVQGTVDTGGNPAVLNAASNFYVRIVTQPAPGSAYYDNENVTNSPPNMTLLVNANSMTATIQNLGPAPVGKYLLEWGITGPIGPVDCSVPFEVDYLPYFTVKGGDIAAGADFANTTGVCTEDSTADIVSWNYDNSGSSNHTGYYGAGAQAAAYALRDIKSFTTGLNPTANSSPLAGRSVNGSITVGTPKSPSAVSFANAGSGVNVSGNVNYGGEFGTLPCIHDYTDDITTGTGSWTDNYAASGTYDVGGDVHIAGGTLPPNTVITIKASGDVYIDGNIDYDDTAGPGHIPRLNIIATNIYISGSVNHIHGMFIAQDGTFATCTTGSDTPSAETTLYDNCHNKLTVYGAVAAKTLHLNRSYGTLTSTSGSAEEFVYSPELWLATPDCKVNPTDAQCTNSNGPSYDAITSLPPIL